MINTADPTNRHDHVADAVCLAVMSLDPTGKGRQRWTNRWKPALNVFTMAFPNRRILPAK